MKTILVGAAAFACIRGPSGAGENGNPGCVAWPRLAFTTACGQRRSLEAMKFLFDRVRDFIQTGAGDARECIDIDAAQFLPAVREGRRPVDLCHLFLSVLTDQEVAAHLQFFLGRTEGLPLVSRVLLATRPPLQFSATRRMSCHQARYVEIDGHDGELIPIEVWEPRIVAPTTS